MSVFSDSARAEGRRVALVPTMGFLHEGHCSLMRIAAGQADIVIVSIFVNPIQFGPGEDFADYPRDWDRDLQMVASTGADCIYAPEVQEMYPEGFQTRVSVAHMTKNLCGVSRPDHFDGVTTVVAKLFNAARPHCAVFGQKDFQQLMVIRRMTRDLQFDIEIVGAPIVREHDGLAMSSRNTYLTPGQRTAARSLSQSLFEARDLFEAGERSAGVLIGRAAERIGREPCAETDYIKICDVETLQECETISRESVMALAVRFGKARLIDNIVLTP